MRDKLVKPWLYWAPRILAIVFIAFIALFSLDVFDAGLTFWETVLAFLMHNIPVFFLVATLVVAWRYELVGAVVFALAGFAYIATAITRAPDWRMALSWSAVIAGPALLVAVLFFLNWSVKVKAGKRKRRSRSRA